MTMAETPASPEVTSAAPRRRSTATDVALVAAFAALIAACTVIGGVPVGGAGVDITLQTFGVLLAGCVLGAARGFLAVVVYLVLGAIGLPVFAGHTGGLSAFTGVSAGYLWSFPVAALLAGFLVQYVFRARRTRAAFVFVAAMAGTALNHACGIVGMKLYLDSTWEQAIKFDAPFWVGDIVKALLVAIVAAEVHRAFPRLLGR
ncbi:biotin transporter BioY [Nocardioides sp. LMS-CY]|uniref:Biotin transporter n=1 Tax=Nocardioides soli TaxID=1036020 RepID=A0A7W4VS08_9ACTN|nr:MULTISPECIES: biotin transporter BioY [Nocardioides]MBB3040674.1 biotin transport system substrate-specific component [Nocardioides soli]QWF23870.1 biotin transporter BioY [Nocardioides sp. LMS-CY]